jgi:hypothetical protein
MATSERDDLERWAKAWRESEPLRSPLTEARSIVAGVRRRTRARAVVFALECGIAVVGLAVVVHLGWVNARPMDRPFAALVGVAIVAFSLFGAWNARGTWRPQRASVRGFIAMEVRRGHRLRAALSAGWALLVAMIVGYVPWILWRVEAPRRSYAFALLGALTVFEVVVLLALARRNHDALQRWSALEEEWQAGGPESTIE